MTEPRVLIGWLLYCLEEGYLKAEDRVIGYNWLLADESTLTDDDIETKEALLIMADEVLAALIEAGWKPPHD